MELLRRYARDNSEEAFATLVNRYVNLVYSAALRKTGNPGAAEEITQAVFVILAKKAGRLSPKTILSGWLYQTARFTAASFLRAEIRRARREQEAYMQSLSNQTESGAGLEIMPLLEDAMGRLGEKDRNAIVLRFFEGKSFQEIGAAVGASENAVKKRVAYGLEKLRKLFAKRGISSTATSLADAISTRSVQAAPAALAKSVAAVALAKGAAAGGSLPVLVKAAMKLMAWQHAKAAVITGAAIVLATGATPLVVKTVNSARTKAYPDITGAWESGEVRVVSRLATTASSSVHAVLKVSRTNGAYSATLDFPELGQRDFPVARFEYKNGNVRLQLYRLGRYEGTVDSTGTEIHGLGLPRSVSAQTVRHFDFVWKRTTHPATPPPPLAESDYAPTQNSILQGVWEGSASIKGIPLRMNLKISEPSEGVFRAEIDSLDTGLRHIPATVTYDKPTVKLTCLGAELAGTMNGSNTEFRTAAPGGSGEIAWTFKRARPEPAGDFSYTTETDLPGHWKGMLNAEGDRLPLSLDIARLPDGKFSATLRGPYQGLNGVSLATVVRYNPPQVRIIWVWGDCSFAGELERGKLSGIWNDGEVSTRLVFERSDLK